MELNEILLFLAMFFPIFFVAVWQLNRFNPNRKAVKAGDNSIKEMYNTYNQQVQDVLKVKDKQIQSLSTKLRNYEQEDEEEPDNPVKPVTWDEITALVTTQYPKYAALLPLAKKQIMDATKGMTMKEILSYVKQFTGNQQSQSPLANPQSAAYNPDWA